MLLFMITVSFGAAAVLILPFVCIYTKGINDVEYIRPVFAYVILLAELLDRAIHICASLPISANKLKESRLGSYSEATINIGISLILIWWEPLLGMAIGTLCAAVIKNVYYIWFSAKKILRVKQWVIVRNLLWAISVVLVCTVLGILLTRSAIITNYFQWIICGTVTTLFITCVVVAVSRLACPDEFKWMQNFLKAKFVK